MNTFSATIVGLVLVLGLATVIAVGSKLAGKLNNTSVETGFFFGPIILAMVALYLNYYGLVNIAPEVAQVVVGVGILSPITALMIRDIIG